MTFFPLFRFFKSEKNQSAKLEKKNTKLTLGKVLENNENNFLQNEKCKSFNSNLDCSFENSQQESIMQSQLQIFRRDITSQITSGSNKVVLTFSYSKFKCLLLALHAFENIKRNNQFKVFNDWLISNDLSYKVIYKHEGGERKGWIDMHITPVK